MFSWCLRVVCLFVLISGTAYGQTAIEGAVHDAAGRGLAKASVSLQHQDGGIAQTTVSDSDGKFRFPGVEGGAYTLGVEAAGYFKATYEFVLRPRQPIALNIDLQEKQIVRQSVDVQSNYLTVDPEKTGSSYTFTRQDLERLPEPIMESTNELVNNLMPGASDSHDNFLAVRGTEFSLHEFINGVSFLDITTRSGADLAGHGNVNFRGATLDTYDLNADYGGQAGKLAYYFFVDGFTSGRYLEPPEPKELFDFGKGSRATAQFDWHAGKKDAFK